MAPSTVRRVAAAVLQRVELRAPRGAGRAHHNAGSLFIGGRQQQGPFRSILSRRPRTRGCRFCLQCRKANYVNEPQLHEFNNDFCFGI